MFSRKKNKGCDSNNVVYGWHTRRNRRLNDFWWVGSTKPTFVNLILMNGILVSKETVVLHRWERWKQKFGFIKRVDKGWITIVKDLESWRFERQPFYSLWQNKKFSFSWRKLFLKIFDEWVSWLHYMSWIALHDQANKPVPVLVLLPGMKAL